MADKNQEYNSLLKLRDAIIGKAEAQKKLKSTTQSLNNMKFTLPLVSERPSITIHTDALKEKYEDPSINIARKAARKRDQRINPIKNFFLVLLAITVLILGGLLIYLAARWSWNTSINSMITQPYMGEMIDYVVAVGIHLFALSIMCIILTAIVGRIAYNSLDHTGWFVALSVILGVCSLASLIASFSYYYSIYNGFWEHLLGFIASFLFFPKFLTAFFIIIPFILTIGLTLGGSGYLIFICFRGVSTRISTYKKPQLDYTPLYESDEYKQAVILDQEATRQDRAEYSVCYQNEKANFEKRQATYRQAIAKYQSIINSCDHTINNANFLHFSYRNLDSVNTILYYFDYNRADSIKEAINEYIRDQQFISMKNQLAAAQQEHMRQMELQRIEFSNKLDKLQNTFVSEISKVSDALNSQTEILKDSLEKLRADNNRNAQRLADEQRESARELAFLYIELRRR